MYAPLVSALLPLHQDCRSVIAYGSMLEGAGVDPQAGFKIDKELLGDKGIAVLRLTGDLDAYTAKLVEAAVRTLFKQGVHRLILDLANVHYMSSAGASLFIIIQSEAVERKGRVVLLNMTPTVRYILDLLGLTPQFRIVASSEAAFEAFQPA
jgi:anti-sigma B factor antagonist